MLNNYNHEENGTGSPEVKSGVQKPNFLQYEDPTGEFDSKKLKYGLWFVKNKLLLYRGLLVFLGMIGGLLWIYSVIQWALYLAGVQDHANLERSLTRFQNFSAIQKMYSPEQLQFETAAIFVGGVDKTDAVAKVANPNRKFLVTFEYNFIIGQTKVPGGKAFILPGETAIIPALGLSKDIAIGEVALETLNMKWQRISTHKVPDPFAFQAERLQFEPKNFVFTPAGREELSVNRLAFTLKNNSAFGFKQPKFYLALYNNNSLVGVMPFETDDFRSLEEKEVDLRNFVNNLQVQKIEVYPAINVYDPTVYLPPEK